jgi:hypothetical protein
MWSQMFEIMKMPLLAHVFQSCVLGLAVLCLRRQPRCGQPDRTVPNPLPIGPAPAPGKRGSRGIPRSSISAFQRFSFQLLPKWGVKGNLRAAMADLEMWVG